MDFPGRGDAVQFRHADVDEGDAEVVSADQFDRFGSVSGLSHDLHVLGVAKDQADTGPEQGIVVDDQYFDHVGAFLRRPVVSPLCGTGSAWGAGVVAIGRSAQTTKQSALGPVVSVPPASRTRSCRPIRPRWAI